MAYREFRNEATYAAPEIEGLPQTLAALDTANRIKAQQGLHNQSLQDKVYESNKNGYFIDNQNKINDMAALTIEATRQWKAGGRQGVPDEVRKIMSDVNALSDKGKVLWEQQKKFEQDIDADKDPYFNKDGAVQELRANYNKPLPEIEQSLANFNPKQDPKFFNATKYADDFVKRYGDKSSEYQTTTNDGTKTAGLAKGKFFTKEGKPGIDPEVVENFLSDDPRADAFYTQAMLKDLNQEYKQIIAGRMNELPDTKEGITLRGLIQNGEDNAAINYLREHPEINPIDQRTEFERKADKIIPELKDREDVQSKKVYDASDKLAGAKWGSGSKTLAGDPADGFQGGPSRTVMLKSGTGQNKLPFLPATISTKRRDKDTGAIVDTGSGNIPMHINYYTWGAADIDGVPYNFKSSNLQNLKKEIEGMTVGERAQMKAAPIFHGVSVDKANALNLSFRKVQELKDEARKNPDGEIAEDLPELEQALNNMGAGKEYDSQLIQKYIGSDVVRNEMFAVTKDDVNETQYEALTGIRVNSPKSLNPEMKEIKDFIESEANKAKKELAPAFKKAVEDNTLRNEAKVVGEPEKKTEPVQLKSSYKVGDKTMSLDELRKLGYSDEQIKEAIKLGNIN
jgi:hypothetical protein